MKDVKTPLEETIKILEKRAKELFPDKIYFTKSEVANILGCSSMTVYRRYRDFNIPPSSKLTVADIASIEHQIRNERN